MLEVTHSSLEEKKSKRKCGICCIPVTSRGVLDCCSDIFCFSCIDTWSAFTNLCPLCKLKFKFITFVPVEEEEESVDLETNEVFFDILGQEREESWITENEEEGALSFPSYFIEDAIVCLDGGGCRVRAGLPQDGEAGLEDTSVACDACDCWYHACCVGYKPDFQTEKSWKCPRCIDTGVSDLLKFQMPSNKGQSSTSSSRNELLNEVGSITFVDEGETAVVVSMDAIICKASDLPAGQFEVDFAAGTHVIPSEKETECLGKEDSAVKLHSTFVETSGTDYVGNKSTPNVFPENVMIENPNNSTSELSPSAICIDDLPKTATSDTEDFCEHQKLEVTSVEPGDIAQDEANLVIEDIEGKGKYNETIHSEERESPQDREDIEVKDKHNEASIHSKKRDIEDIEVKDKYNETIHSKKRESPQDQEENLSDNKRLKSDHRKSFLETNRSSLVSSSIRPLQKKISSKSAGISGKKLYDRDFADDSCDEKEPDNDDTNCTISTVSLQEALNPKSMVMDELKELVQGLSPCRRRVILPRASVMEREIGENEDMKTKRIVYRGGELDTNASKIIDQMRQYLKEASTASNITGKVNVTDEKFFIAFKTAILKSQTDAKRHDTPLQKTVIRKPGSKHDASRQSLMKKLYGGSGKRRQTWDRDWDVSFWRERVSHEKKAKQSSMDLLQKEIAQIKQTFCDTKKEDKAELDSLRSRIYLADTSLLPRKNDIKPLSAQLESKQPPKQSKVPVPSKVAEQAVNHAPATEECMDNKQTPKLDKRKWALDVLARKNKQISCQRKKGSLLEELPGHLRPILEYDRRSKVPTASRQMQLDRFVEYYLQSAELQSLDENPECKAAIAAAVSKEKEIYDRSNSKGVYVNLCVQALSMAPKEVLTQASEAASCPTSETRELEDVVVLDAWKAAGLISDSPPESPVCGKESSDRSLPENDNLVRTPRENSAEKIEVTFEVDKGSILDKEEATRNEEKTNNANDIIDINEEMPLVLNCSNEESILENKVDNVSAIDEFIPLSNEGFQSNNSLQQDEDRSNRGPATPISCAVTTPSDQETFFTGNNNTEKPIDDISQTEQISKQVETYVKEHIRPLLRSHVITTEQYRWAITKTTRKVMQHHAQAKSASFLIPEGEKVKRLAEQYLALYTEQNQ